MREIKASQRLYNSSEFENMKNYFYAWAAILLATSSNLLAQNSKENTTQSSNGSFFEKVSLRKSFQSKNDKAEPAVFTYTNPRDKAESWLLNAAIGFNVLSQTQKVITLSPYFEYHRNTLIDKEQNNIQSGLALEWQLWQLKDSSTREWTPILITSTKYNKDLVKDVSSFQGNYALTFLFQRERKGCQILL